MGTFVNNQIYITRKKEGMEMLETDLEEIKNYLLEAFEDDKDCYRWEIECLSTLMDLSNATNLYNDYTKSVFIDNSAFSLMLQDGLYMQFTFQNINYSLEYESLNQLFEGKYNFQIISIEELNRQLPNMYMVTEEVDSLKSLTHTFKAILLKVLQNKETVDALIRIIIQSNDIDLIKQSVRNANISDKTLDLIFQNYKTDELNTLKSPF